MKKIGRPTIYKDQMVEKSQYYLDNYDKFGDVIPQICSLAIHLGIHKDTIYDWIKHSDKEKFSDVVSKVFFSQEKTLINCGLTGKFSAKIAQLLLSKHGYRDTKEIDANVRGLNDLSDEELEKRKIALLSE